MATKSRRCSKADEVFTPHDMDKLLKEDIIEPSTSSWRAQVLVTPHKKCMVVDYSQTINPNFFHTHLDAYPQKRIDTKVKTYTSTGILAQLTRKVLITKSP